MGSLKKHKKTMKKNIQNIKKHKKNVKKHKKTMKKKEQDNLGGLFSSSESESNNEYWNEYENGNRSNNENIYGNGSNKESENENENEYRYGNGSNNENENENRKENGNIYYENGNNNEYWNEKENGNNNEYWNENENGNGKENESENENENENRNENGNENENRNGNGYRNISEDDETENEDENEDEDEERENDELYELEDDIIMKLASLNVDDYEEDIICGFNTMHNLEEQLIESNEKICNVENSVRELIQVKAQEVLTNFLEKNHSTTYIPRDTRQWLTRFRTIYEFQRFTENDIKHGIQYMLPTYNPDNEYLIDLVDENEECIQRLFNEYRFKIITSYFTKASITYANYLFNPYTWNRSEYELVKEINYGFANYHYLNNLFCILSLANQGINTTLNQQWNSYVEELRCNNSSYIHSGGNIFVLLGGILCYIKNREMVTSHTKMNNIVEKLYQRIGGENYSGFTQYLNHLFEEEDFQYSFQVIMSGLSDMDFLFMSSNEGIFQHRDSSNDTHASDVNALSASILRTILHDTLEGNGTYNALFPFMEGYSSEHGRCRMFNNSNINHKNMDKINANGFLSKYFGYRQTSSYIDNINIYLNRIKQAYLPLDEECINEYELYIKKYGECIDLVVGSTNNNIFNHKYKLFKEGHIYSIKALFTELEIIRENTLDDKSDKRLQRMYFLQKLIESNFYHTFNYLLVLCYEEIHTNKQGHLIGFPCPHGYNQQQSLNYAKENLPSIYLNNEL